jgi:hypothetical protein
MVESRQSAGGKARAQRLSKQERSDIARTAAAARWNSAKDHVNERSVKADDERHHLQCGAAVIRNAIARLPEEERKSFVLMLWPTLPQELCELVARFPDETRVNGSQLHLPASWYSISGVKAPTTK